MDMLEVPGQGLEQFVIVIDGPVGTAAERFDQLRLVIDADPIQPGDIVAEFAHRLAAIIVQLKLDFAIFEYPRPGSGIIPGTTKSYTAVIISLMTGLLHVYLVKGHFLQTFDSTLHRDGAVLIGTQAVQKMSSAFMIHPSVAIKNHDTRRLYSYKAINIKKKT
jgi:hypothetical protein